jgi:Flp pilus assembly protein TadG
VVTKSPRHNHRNSSLRSNNPANAGFSRGATTIQVLVLLVPVFLGLIGFAFDLGRLYSARNDLKEAANSMALAMATQLIGTDLATSTASNFGEQTVDNSSGFGNKYDFNGNVVGQVNGTLNSVVSDPQFYGTLTDAIGSANEGSGNTTGGASAKYVRVNINGETPIVFWNFLNLVQNRRTTVQATAVAGISAPLCTACGIEPIAVPAVDQTDLVNFGFTPGTLYTLAYLCSGGGTPATLAGGGAVVEYVLLNRLSTNGQIFTGETSQLLRMGADGLPPSTIQTDACFFVNTTEQIWASATPVACMGATVNASTQAFLCGVALRFNSSLLGNCTGIPEADSIATIYSQDPDLTSITDYTQYLGYGRRVLTIPIVDSTANTAAMTVLGFRQFLVEPDANGTNIDSTDANGRFNVMYLGSVAPVRQGSFGGCSQTAGPGKVVLHR